MATWLLSGAREGATAAAAAATSLSHVALPDSRLPTRSSAWHAQQRRARVGPGIVLQRAHSSADVIKRPLSRRGEEEGARLQDALGGAGGGRGRGREAALAPDAPDAPDAAGGRRLLRVGLGRRRLVWKTTRALSREPDFVKRLDCLGRNLFFLTCLFRSNNLYLSCSDICCWRFCFFFIARPCARVRLHYFLFI